MPVECVDYSSPVLFGAGDAVGATAAAAATIIIVAE